MTFDIPAIVTTTLGFAVFIIGAMVNSRLGVLRQFNIPEPVTGGLLASLVALGLYVGLDIELQFDLVTRDAFLLVFFAGIGLNARLRDLINGGMPLLILLALTLFAILGQNLIGMAGAVVFGFPAQLGVMFGSAALIGGHGTAIAWSPEIQAATGVASAPELGIAVATLGLVLAALVGGPIARHLVERHDLTPDNPDAGQTIGLPQETDDKDRETLQPLSVMSVLFYLNVAIILGFLLDEVIDGIGIKLPLFVSCLFMAIVVSNLRALIAPKAAPVARTPALALISEISLGAFLAMSLMSLQLWTIASLGLTILIILALQAGFVVAFVIFVLFPLMGSGYRAAVLAAGFGGFALGATPTAIANMTAVTKRYGPSPVAFVILPLVSAFFVDIANAIVIQTILSF